MRSGVVSARPTLVRLIEEIAGGAWPGSETCWPTPGASLPNDGESPATWRARQVAHKARGINGNGMGVPLAIVAQEAMAPHWPTANTRDAASAGRHSTTTGVMHPGTTLTDAARLWPTAQAHDTGRSPAAHMAMRKRVWGGDPTTATSLAVAAKLWPTSRSEDAESTGTHRGRDNDTLTSATREWQTPKSGGRNAYRGGPRSEEPLLAGQAQEATESATSWMTPAAGGGTGYLSGSNRDTWRPTLDSQVRGAQPILHSPVGLRTPTTTTPGEPSSASVQTSPQPWLPSHDAEPPLQRQLNPSFVEWLMGLPIGWTCICPVAAPAPIVSAASATPSSPTRPRRRSVSSGTVRSASGPDAWVGLAVALYRTAP
jgi:hypothetical protein